MFEQEDIQQLCDNPQLLQLLTHYADAGAADRKVWQDRLMTMAELTPVQITRLHGELLAFEWIEQNTGAPRASYRITPAGLRSLKQAVHGGDDDGEVAEPESPTPAKTRKKKATLQPALADS